MPDFGILLEGGEEGMGFGIPSMGFSVKPHVQAYTTLQSSLVYKIFSGHLCSHIGYCSTCSSPPPPPLSAVSSPPLFISYNVFLGFPLPWNLLSSLNSLAILLTVGFNHFFFNSITVSLMRFWGWKRCNSICPVHSLETTYTVKCSGRRPGFWGDEMVHFMMHFCTAQFVTFVHASVIFTKEIKNTGKNPVQWLAVSLQWVMLRTFPGT